ncbi:hypothetical protein L2E82_28305 [Cichorium intybus]|uniref:Uncharacterized protein n=1 Tax=Cichorium intybus TaxID=13427 RepID=A0ACB9CW19_CICIN|nr:hypothetical protein L2E82_28305 [Cichorium intybus]
MVFHCRCFSFPYEEDQEIEYETRTETKSTSTHTYYTAPSDLNRSISEFHGKTSGVTNLPRKPNNPRIFTVVELNEATNNFSRERNIGEGGFGKVYRGVIKSLEHPFDEIQVAVKYAKGEMEASFCLLTLSYHYGRISTKSFMKIDLAPEWFPVCCCYRSIHNKTQYLFDYVETGARRVVNRARRSKTPLSWTRRLKVAQDAARGLAYLHEETGSEFQGTVLYAAPEYIESGHLSSKSDVWSYGVFLYELITAYHRSQTSRKLNEVGTRVGQYCQALLAQTPEIEAKDE